MFDQAAFGKSATENHLFIPLSKRPGDLAALKPKGYLFRISAQLKLKLKLCFWKTVLGFDRYTFRSASIRSEEAFLESTCLSYKD